MIRSRDTHVALNGKCAKHGERFPGSVLRFPGDPDAPAREVINCFCALVPDVLPPGQTIDENGNVIKSKEPSIETGAKKTRGWQDRHAERYYQEIRARAPKTDAKKIAKNASVRFSVDQIEKVRQHVFVQEHDLEKGHVRFDPSFEQAQVWQRLTEGRPLESDIIFLEHEYLELTLMGEKGYNYTEAHEKANRQYNWWQAVLREKDEEGES